MIVSLQTTSRSLGLALACTLLALANEVRAADLVLPQAKPVKLAGDFKFTEGPAVSVNGDVYFTDIPNNRIHKWSASNKELSIFAEETNGANGLYFADDGRLFACQGNAKRVVAYSADGNDTNSLAKRYDGKKFNKPNDLWIDLKGGVYFSDPNYGNKELSQDGKHVYYIQPGGEVLTDASGRQDSDNISDLAEYYYSYLYFSHRDKNPVYAAVCDFIENNLTHKLIRFIPYLFENHYLLNKRVSPTKFPTSYFKRFKHSGVFRIRQSNFDVSIIENNLTFLSLIKGSAVLQSLRLGSTFFGSRGQFTAENIEVNKNQIILTKSIKHGYFQPFPEDKIIGDGVYSKNAT